MRDVDRELTGLRRPPEGWCSRATRTTWSSRAPGPSHASRRVRSSTRRPSDWRGTASWSTKKTRIVTPGARKIVLGLLVDGSRPRLLPEFKRRIEVHVRGVERNGLPEHAEHRRFDSILAMINHVDGCIAFAGSVEQDYADGIARRWAEVLVARGYPRPGADSGCQATACTLQAQRTSALTKHALQTISRLAAFDASRHGHWSLTDLSRLLLSQHTMRQERRSANRSCRVSSGRWSATRASPGSRPFGCGPQLPRTAAWSDVLDRIRRELQQRLESTRAAAQEHERVRAALEALEHAVKPLEEVTRRAASGASRARASRGRPREAGELPLSSATTESDAATASATRPARTARPRATGSRKSAGTGRGRKAASASTAKAGASEGGAPGGRGTVKPVRARAPGALIARRCSPSCATGPA